MPTFFAVFKNRFWYNACDQRRNKVQDVRLETELHVTTPNEPGILGRVLGTLANSAVNLRAMNAYADKDQGRFFLITSDNAKAAKCLKALGYAVDTQEVVTIPIDDRIGSGAEVGALLGNAVIDVLYSYCTSTSSGKVLMVIQTNDNKKALDTLS